MAIQAQRVGGSFWSRLTPRSRLGWWAAGLAAAVVLLQALAYLAIFVGLETSDFAPAVVIPIGLAIISGAAALIVGVLSIITRRERSILVFLSALVGFAYFALWAITFVSGLTGSGPSGPIPSPPPPPG
jgi:hypothetical protein